MWIVRLALRRPYTFVVAALALLLLGVVTISRMPTDIFPVIDIPVVSIIWPFTGISPEDMEKRIVTVSERTFTTTVNDIERTESQSMPSIAVIKVFIQGAARIEAAVAQLTTVMQTILHALPPGINPPLIGMLPMAFRRRWRAEPAAGTRRHRRTVGRHRCHSVLCAGGL
jgi:multidrug efflux pump subunit AcrB